MHVPLEGLSEHTKCRAQDIINGEGRDVWKRSEDYRIFANSLKQQVKTAGIDALMLYVNDIQFTDARIDALVEIAER